MLKAEKTMQKNRINIVDTEKKGDDFYIQQLSKEDAIYLLRSLLSILLPIKQNLKGS